jgi:hypothetical protein
LQTHGLFEIACKNFFHASAHYTLSMAPMYRRACKEFKTRTVPRSSKRVFRIVVDFCKIFNNSHFIVTATSEEYMK